MEDTSRRSKLGPHQPCYSERINSLSDSIECNHPQETLPAYCIPKVARMETGEVLSEKVYMTPRLPPKISLKTNGKENWVQNMLNDQKLGNVSNRTNQFQIQCVRERGDPLSRRT